MMLGDMVMVLMGVGGGDGEYLFEVKMFAGGDGGVGIEYTLLLF